MTEAGIHEAICRNCGHIADIAPIDADKDRRARLAARLEAAAAERVKPGTLGGLFREAADELARADAEVGRLTELHDRLARINTENATRVLDRDDRLKELEAEVGRLTREVEDLKAAKTQPVLTRETLRHDGRR